MKQLAVFSILMVMVLGMAFAGGAGEDKSKPIVFVWLPNDSVPESAAFRAAVDKIVSDATGRKVVDKFTTDYNIAVEAMATDNAGLAFFGAAQYVLAASKNKMVVPIVTNSGNSGTMADASYFSRLLVNEADAAQYMKDGKFAIDNIQGKRFSFVSNSSTSGFLFPATGIVSYFKKQAKWSKLTTADLIEGGSDKFFSQVLFGGSHQGSLANLLTGKADVVAADDIDVAAYVKQIAGTDKTDPGSIYEVKSDAADPFSGVPGKRYEVIWSIPVLNGPITGNANVLSKSELEKIQAAFMADSVMTNPDLWVVPGGKNKAAFKQTGKVRFLPVTAATYQPIVDKMK